MDIEKQVEEMARAISKDCEENCDWCALYGGCTNLHWAKEFYDAGYRKVSEVAEDIFKRLYQHIKFDGHTIGVWKNDLLCIAKEYDVHLE